MSKLNSTALAAVLVAGATGCTSAQSQSQPPLMAHAPYGTQPSHAAPSPPAPAPASLPPQPVSVAEALAPFGIVIEYNPQQPPFPQLQGWLESNFPGWFQFPQPSGPPAPNPGPPSPPVQPPPSPPVQPPPSGPGGELPAGWTRAEYEVLLETNRVRAQGAVCGGKSMPPAPPLQPQLQLQRAARAHSQDMAARDYFDHDTPEGLGPSERAARQGYRGGVGENIAAGTSTAHSTVQMWLDSPGHCLNMMANDYQFLGVGYGFQNGSEFGHYWTQNFG